MTPKEAYRLYCRALKRSCRLELAGLGDGPEYDALCDTMYDMWWSMTGRQQGLADRCAERLNRAMDGMALDAPAPPRP